MSSPAFAEHFSPLATERRRSIRDILPDLRQEEAPYHWRWPLIAAWVAVAIAVSMQGYLQIGNPAPAAHLQSEYGALDFYRWNGFYRVVSSSQKR